jgi:hypothetical protein
MTGSNPGDKTLRNLDATNKDSGGKNKRKGEDNKRSQSAADKGNGPRAPSAPTARCYGCGYKMTKNADKKLRCPRKPDASTEEIGCRNDPRRNNEKGTPFLESTVGKQWLAKGFKSLPRDTTITLANADSRLQVQPNKGIYLHSSYTCNPTLQSELIPFSLQQEESKSQSAKKRNKLSARPPPPGQLLLDTGAVGANVISTQYAKKLRQHSNSHTTSAARHTIFTAANKKLLSNKLLNLKLNLVTERSQPATTQVKVSAVVAPIEVDLVVDRATIKTNNLVQHFPSHFAEGELLERIQAIPILKSNTQEVPHAGPPAAIGPSSLGMFAVDKTTSNPWLQTMGRQDPIRAFFRDQQAATEVEEQVALQEPLSSFPVFLATMSTETEEEPLKRDQTQTNWKPFHTEQPLAWLGSFLATLRTKPALTPSSTSTSNFSEKNPFLREGTGMSEIPDHKLESIPSGLLQEVVEDHEFTKVHLDGPHGVQDSLRRFTREFKATFSSTVQRKPATFPPFELQVNLDLWEQPCNSLPPRTMGRERQQEMDRMINILIQHDVIEYCYDPYYSHAFLTPKSNGTWRMVLDFKNLNKATTSKFAWPIPNIKEMLTRIGDSRPKFFAVFDLTSGYYQAPIAEESRKYTAFKTHNGVYRWKRLPMGLTDAGSYFQHQLSTKVLNGLIHIVCELYLDDCIVYASTLAEYMERLRLVFQRFREHNITLNPSKCYLGLTQVEYVGHTINEHGLHFTRDKVDSVLNFPRPTTCKNVKSFIGLANYFRDHILNHSLRVQALQDLVANYSKKVAHRQVEWTDECETAFNDIRQAIDECPLLWFVDDVSPIFLQTDASDYGIGAYLYQTVLQEGGSSIEHPIGFISKSLVSGYGTWDIPMKEGFAIFYALRKWEYLLRDRKFTILTDHENLTRLRTERSANKMVSRWFTVYQEYDIIEWVHVPGVHNEVPDSFSRLCANNIEDNTPDTHPAVFLNMLTGYEMDPEHWDIIRTKGHGNDSDKGHGGVERTIDTLEAQELSWPSRRKDVRKFIKMCPCCQKMNRIKPVVHSYPFTLSSSEPFHTVSVDLIENLRVDDFGQSMIVVIIDNFSRFVDLYPISNTSAEAAADALIQFTGRFKTPIQFTTDSGSNFASDLMKGLTARLGAHHELTAAYSKEQNGIVERVNREVLSHLRAVIFDKRIQRQWSKFLPIVQRYINTSRHSATGCTPAEIIFPSGADIDRQLLDDMHTVPASSYIRDMQDAQARVIDIARQHLLQRDQKHMEARQEHVPPDFKPNDYVLVEHRHNSLRSGPKSKLLPFLAGPLIVVERRPDGMYSLRDLITMTKKLFHESKMRPFRYDERTLQPIQVAATDSFDEFVVEKVLAMRGNPRGSRSQIQFLVKWAGYEESENSWVDWADGRDSTAIQLFLYNHDNPRIRRLGKPGFDPDNLEDDGLPFNRNSDHESDAD